MGGATTPASPAAPPRAIAVAALTAVALLAAGTALAVVQPFSAGPVSYDAGSSVVHFERLVAGHHLESFISTTPKPLLTLVFGVLYALTHDWRAISIATVSAYALGIALATWLAARLAGPVAGSFAAVALIASTSFMGEVMIASAIPWALLGWAGAGLAVTARRPRYVLAGAALLLATLARLETLVVVGTALVALCGLWVLERRRGGTRAPRGAWWVLLGFGALPVMLVHDWLLTGDPFFWASVSTRYSEGAGAASILHPLELLRFLTHRYLGLAGFDALALVGIAALVRARAWAVAVGLAGLGPALVAFLFVLSAHGTFVATRYAVPVDLAVLFTAALGAAAIARYTLEQLRQRWPAGRWAAAPVQPIVAISAIAALAIGWPPSLLAATTRMAATAALRLAVDERRAVPILEAALGNITGSRDLSAAQGTRPQVLSVPVPMRTLVANDLGIPLSRIGSTNAAGLTPLPGLLATTDIVVHDRAGDPPNPAYAALEATAVTIVGGETITPLLADPQGGLWIYLVTGP